MNALSCMFLTTVKSPPGTSLMASEVGARSLCDDSWLAEIPSKGRKNYGPGWWTSSDAQEPCLHTPLRVHGEEGWEAWVWLLDVLSPGLVILLLRATSRISGTWSSPFCWKLGGGGSSPRLISRQGGQGGSEGWGRLGWKGVSKGNWGDAWSLAQNEWAQLCALAWHLGNLFLVLNEDWRTLLLWCECPLQHSYWGLTGMQMTLGSDQLWSGVR